MIKLRDIQSDFIHDIYTGEKTSSRYLSLHKDYTARLSIYSNNTLLGLTDSLGNIYPIVHKIVGKNFFNMMARDFIKINHQQFGNRNKFGSELALFLKTYTPATSLTYLSDIAALEWAYFQSAIADDRETLTFEELSQNITSYPHYILSVNPSVSIVPQTYNALEIWQAHQQDPIESIELKSDISTLLVWRDRDHTILIRKISNAFHRLIEQCQNKISFAEAINTASQYADNFEIFQKEFSDGVSLSLFTQESID